VDDAAPLQYSREYGAVFIDFPEPLVVATDLYYVNLNKQ
jgi:hypothetical protein